MFLRLFLRVNQAFEYGVYLKIKSKQRKLSWQTKIEEEMNEIGVEVKLDKVQRPGIFNRERSNPKNTIVTPSNDWDIRSNLAKCSEKWIRMREMATSFPHNLPKTRNGKNCD